MVVHVRLTLALRPLPLPQSLAILALYHFCSATFFAFQVLGVIVIPKVINVEHSRKVTVAL